MKYFSQTGGDIGAVYRASIYRQRGRGLGSFFSGLWRFVRPLVLSGAKAVGREAKEAGLKALSDINNGKSLKEILQTRSGEAVHNLKTKLESKIGEMSGSGLKRAKIRKVAIKKKGIRSRSRKQKNKPKQIGGSLKKYKNSRKKRQTHRRRDIFG